MRIFFKFLAREFVANIKNAMIAGAIAIVAFFVLYFVKQPDYYSPQEIAADNAFNDSIKTSHASTRISQHKKHNKNEYKKYEDVESSTIMTGHRGIESEYKVSVVLGENLVQVNEAVKNNFLNHISHDAYTVFLIAFGLLFIQHYFAMIYRYSKLE